MLLIVYHDTGKYPAEEKFGLVSQSRRAAVSVTSNIAEGFGRYSAKDKGHFYTMAKTSLAELQNQLIVARDLQFLPSDVFEKMFEQSEHAGSLIKGLMRSVAA